MLLKTRQVHHRPDLHIMPIPGKDIHLLVDYKAAFGSPIMDRVFAAMAMA